MDLRIKQTIIFLEENLEKKLNLKRISEISNLSESYFSELFKKEMGICFSKYLKQTRIKKALHLFSKNNSLSVKQVSYKVGYRHISNFNHDFKRIVGMSPLKFKSLRKMKP